METSNTSPLSMDRQEPKKPVRVLDRRPTHQTLKPSSLVGFTSELFGVLLNVFTISLVLMSYFVVRSCYEFTRKVNNALWYYPDKVSRCPTFTSYYNKVLVYLEERKRKASENFVYRQVTSNDVDYVVTEEEVEVERLQEEFPEQNSEGSGSTTPLMPETPTVVIAEVHTQDTPESSDNESPRSMRFRDQSEGMGGKKRKSLVEELDDKTEDDGGFPEQKSEGSSGSTTPLMADSPTIVMAEVHTQEFHEQESEGSGSTTPLMPETPTVVIAEVHTQDTPESSDNESPRSVKFRDQSEGIEGKTRKSLVEELDDETEDDSSEEETE